MAIKVESKKDALGVMTVFTDNHVCEPVITRVKELLEENDKVKVSWDVMGATMHDILSHQLKEQMPNYNFEIGRYKCLITK